MARPPIPADALDETVQDDAPVQDHAPKVKHDPGGGRSSVNQREQGDVKNDSGAPAAPDA